MVISKLSRHLGQFVPAVPSPIIKVISGPEQELRIGAGSRQEIVLVASGEYKLGSKIRSRTLCYGRFRRDLTISPEARDNVDDLNVVVTLGSKHYHLRRIVRYRLTWFSVSL
mgnify:CR=1 FL=1